MTDKRPSPSAPDVGTALDALLEAERGCAHALAAARAEAEARVERARSEARLRTAAAAEALDAEVEARTLALDGAHRAHLAALTAEGNRVAAWFAAVDDGRVSELADGLAARILSGEVSP